MEPPRNSLPTELQMLFGWMPVINITLHHGRYKSGNDVIKGGSPVFFKIHSLSVLYFNDDLKTWIMIFVVASFGSKEFMKHTKTLVWFAITNKVSHWHNNNDRSRALLNDVMENTKFSVGKTQAFYHLLVLMVIQVASMIGRLQSPVGWDIGRTYQFLILQNSDETEKIEGYLAPVGLAGVCLATLKFGAQSVSVHQAL